MSRVFLALNLPDEAKDKLAQLADQAGDLPAARWVSSENFHVTLKFFGELSDQRQALACETLARLDETVQPLALQGLGLFPLRGQPETLWVGVVPTPDLLRLQRRIEKSLSQVGFAPEGRNYHPHVTVARLHEQGDPSLLARFLARHALFKLNTVATSFSLFASHPTSQGSVYSELERFPLYGVTGDEEDEMDEPDETL